MNLPYMPFFVGDYTKDTRHLTLEQHGAYLLILMHLWEHSSIKVDKICRVVGVSKSDWDALSEEILELLDVVDGVAKSPKMERVRLDAETKYESKKAQAKKASEARWAKKEMREDMQEHMREDMPTHMLPQCGGNANQNQNQIVSPNGDPNEFVCLAQARANPEKSDFVAYGVASFGHKGLSESEWGDMWQDFEAQDWKDANGKSISAKWKSAMGYKADYVKKHRGQQPRQQFLTAAERDRDERNELAKQIKANGGVFAGFA